MAVRQSIPSLALAIKPFPDNLDRYRFGDYLSGFLDGEGHLSAGSYAVGNHRRHALELVVNLRADDRGILEMMQGYLNCGHINERRQRKSGGRPGDENLQFRYAVSSVADLTQKVLPHFESHPLRAKKSAELPFWKSAVLLANAVADRRSSGLGLNRQELAWQAAEEEEFCRLSSSARLRRRFVGTPKMYKREMDSLNRRPDPFPNNVDPYRFGDYLSGLVDGEGYFCAVAFTGRQAKERRHQTVEVSKTGFAILLRADDLPILRLIHSYLQCGRFVWHQPPKSESRANPKICYRVDKIADLQGIVVPHFDRHPLMAKKAKDFQIWKRAVDLSYRVRNLRPGKPVRWPPEDRAQFAGLVASLKENRRFTP